MTSYLGIDPGLDGGVAAILSTSGYTSLIKYVMPTSSVIEGDKKRREIDRDSLLSLLHSCPPPTFAIIEEQIPVRNQDIKATFTTAKNYGILLMTLWITNIKMVEVSANDWHSHFGIVNNKKGEGKTTKVQAFEICKQLYPDENFRKSERSKVFHDGIVDATLLARYCKFLEERDERK